MEMFMRNLRKLFLVVLAACAVCTRVMAITFGPIGNDGEEAAAATLTFLSEYLVQSGKDYEQQYKILQNALKQLETQGKQLEEQIREATGLDFGSIGFSGASDKIKGSSVYKDAKNAWDALSNAGEKVQQMYSDIRKVYEALEDAAIMIDGIPYSIADIAGVGFPNQDFGCFGTAVTKSTVSKFQQSAEDWEAKLTDREKEYIQRKFGMSPSDYYLTGQLRNQLSQMTDRMMARTDSRLEKVQADRQAVNDAIKQANIQLNAAGITDKQISQINAKTTNAILASLESMKEIMEDNITRDVSRANMEYKKQEAEKEAELKRKEAQALMNYASRTPDYWKNSSSDGNNSDFSTRGHEEDASIYSKGWKKDDERKSIWSNLFSSDEE